MKLHSANCSHILHMLVLSLLEITVKKPTAATAVHTKGIFSRQTKISTNRRQICKKRSLETVETSSTIIVLTYENLFHNGDLNLSLKGGKFFPKIPTGTLRPVCILVPSIFIAAAPVGVKSNTFVFLLILSFCKKTFL